MAPASREKRRGSGRLLVLALASCLVFQYISWTHAGAIRAEVPSPQPREVGFITKVIGAAAQGATAALVAAILSASLEPLASRTLVKRMTFAEASKGVNLGSVRKFFLMIFPTKFMFKFPVFEVINTILTFTGLSGSLRGVITGFLFCNIILPLENYHFRASKGWEITPAALYQAYLPSVVRDVVYGWSRGFVGCAISGLPLPKVVLFGITVFSACILASPVEQWRGYTLQPKERRPPFKPVNYALSTGVGATIMSVGLGVGMFIAQYVEQFVSFLGTLI